MAKIILEKEGKETMLSDNSLIKESCEQLGVPFSCTQGFCGTCEIEITKGKENLHSKSERELALLGEDNNKRLACQCKIKKGIIKIRF